MLLEMECSCFEHRKGGRTCSDIGYAVKLTFEDKFGKQVDMYFCATDFENYFNNDKEVLQVLLTQQTLEDYTLVQKIIDILKPKNKYDFSKAMFEKWKLDI